MRKKSKGGLQGKEGCHLYIVNTKDYFKNYGGKNYASAKLNGFVAFAKKHGPHIRHTIDGKVVD